MADRHNSGSAGSPIKFRTNAHRQTEGQPRPQQQTIRRQMSDDDENEDIWTTKTHTSAIRYSYQSPRNATRDVGNPKRTQVVRESKRRFDKYTLIIVASLLIIVMVGGWWLLTTISTWWMNWQDDLHYGNPRTFQVDQFVGQGDSPSQPDHFIVVNIHGRVVVLQVNVQHPELDQTYGITTTDPNTPVSLIFRQQGKTLAMYVVIGNNETSYTVELVSNGTKFVGTH